MSVLLQCSLVNARLSDTITISGDGQGLMSSFSVPLLFNSWFHRQCHRPNADSLNSINLFSVWRFQCKQSTTFFVQHHYIMVDYHFRALCHITSIRQWLLTMAHQLRCKLIGLVCTEHHVTVTWHLFISHEQARHSKLLAKGWAARERQTRRQR